MGYKIIRILKKFRISRIAVLFLAFCIMSMTLIRQVFDLQIIQGQNYISSFESRTTKTRVIKSTRGNIYDRNGVMLASNVLSYSLTLEDNGSYSSTREKNLTLNGVAYRVPKILASNGDTLGITFHIELDEDGNYAFDVGEGFTLNRFKADIYGHALIDDLTEEERNATAAEMIDYLSGSKGFSIVLYGERAYSKEELESHGLPEQLTMQEVLDISKVRYQLSTNSFKKYLPVTIATNVSEYSIAAIMENLSTLQGIDVVEDSMRQYIDEESMGPVLGYTGKASAEELQALQKDNPDYSVDSIIGKAGIEQYMELYLQGKDGEETVYVDNLGKVLRIDENTKVDPVAGNDLYLTIDSDWQSAIYEMLKERVAGILLSKIVSAKTYEYETAESAAEIVIPIYDVYNALVSNTVIDIRKFEEEDASEVEKALYSIFQSKQEEIFAVISDRLNGVNPPSYEEETEEIQAYCDYIANTLLPGTLGIIKSASIDTSDSTYREYHSSGSISLKDYLTYAASQNWIDISGISPEGEYLDSGEIYSSLSAYILDYLKTDTSFSKLLYKYLLFEDRITGQQLCLCLYEQGILSKEDDTYANLASGAMTSYDFMINKIWTLEIEPADLALNPCSASAVVTDVNTGDVLAVVSYPGYDNNRLSNTMDTSYYAKLALDQSSPFFNKATQQLTAPGSTFKLVSAIAGLMEGVIDAETLYECTGSFDLVEPPINCWNILGHGTLDIREAITESCNYFFNMVGFQLGKSGDSFSENLSLQKLQDYASAIGLDKKTGIELTEATPRVSDSYAVPSYIGQGTHLYTTVGLARYAAALANKGSVYELSLLDRVEDATGEIVRTYESQVSNVMNVDSSVWDAVEDGMVGVINEHEQFDDLTIQAAGKTGTAEVDLYHPNHGLFIGYAPADAPQYAISVRIANGYTSGNACLVADDIFKYIFNLAEYDEIVTGYASSETSTTSND